MPISERKWSTFHDENNVGIVLSDLTPEEQDSHVPILLTVPSGHRDFKLDDLEEPLDELLSTQNWGFFAGHTQRLDAVPPRYCLFLIRKDLMEPGLDAVRTFLSKQSRFGKVELEVLSKFPEWAEIQVTASQLSALPKISTAPKPSGCLWGLFGPKDVLLDVWFFEEWDYEGQKSPAFAAIEQRLIPAIESRLLGSHEGEGSFVDRVQYNVGFVIKKKYVTTAIEVLSRELRAMGAPRSTQIEANGQSHNVY